MQTVLLDKLRAYVTEHNPELLLKLQGDYSVKQYLEDSVSAVMPMVAQMLSEGKPNYIIEELCLYELTTDLRPSRFDYLKTVLAEDFPDDYKRMVHAGVLTYEVVNLIEVCEEVFESHGFTEETMDNPVLRHAIIYEIYGQL